jgi:hypothetical protein
MRDGVEILRDVCVYHLGLPHPKLQREVIHRLMGISLRPEPIRVVLFNRLGVRSLILTILLFWFIWSVWSIWINLVYDWNRAFHAGIYPSGVEVSLRLE